MGVNAVAGRPRRKKTAASADAAKSVREECIRPEQKTGRMPPL